MSCSNSTKLLYEGKNPTYCIGVFEDLSDGGINLSAIIVYADVNETRGIVVNNLSEGESIEIGLGDANLEDSQYENDLHVTFMKNALNFFRELALN